MARTAQAARAVFIAFRRATSLARGDLVITPLDGGQTSVKPTAVAFDATTGTARFTFATLLPDGNYRATIRGVDVADLTASRPVKAGR